MTGHKAGGEIPSTSLRASPSDEQLAQRTLAGEEAAFDELVRRHQSRVYHLAYRMCRHRDLADDWAQEAFVRAYDQLRRFDASRPFVPWLLKVATNVFLNQARVKRPATLSLDAPDDAPFGGDEQPLQLADLAPTPAQTLEQREFSQLVNSAIAQLPDKYRLVILLRHMEEMEYDDIADAMQIPIGTVKTFLHRGRERLRELLEPVIEA